MKKKKKKRERERERERERARVQKIDLGGVLFRLTFDHLWLWVQHIIQALFLGTISSMK